jgi:hypothetical protein
MVILAVVIKGIFRGINTGKKGAHYATKKEKQGAEADKRARRDLILTKSYHYSCYVTASR